MIKKINKITSCIIIILSCILTIGVRTVFHACAPMEDGSFMSCYWAQQAVFALGIAMIVIGILSLLLPGRIVTGLALGEIIVSVTAMLVPGRVIDLCMMPDMQCRAVMRPAVLVLCAVIAIISVICLLTSLKKESNAK